MDISPLSKIIYITERLNTFNLNDMKKFKKSFMSVIDCSREQELFIKLILLSYKHLSDQCIETLRQEAIEIDTHRKQNLKKQSRVANIYSNAFSVVPSPVIDTIGKFLTKHDCVQFSQSNRHLFAETQKKSFIAQRSSVDNLTVSLPPLEHGLIEIDCRYNFSYSVPKALCLGSISTDMEQVRRHKPMTNIEFLSLQKSKWFQSLFTRVDTLRIFDARYLKYIPVNILFNKYNRHNIEELSLDMSNYVTLTIIKRFCKQYRKYFHTQCETIKYQSIRKLKRLSLSANLTACPNQSSFELSPSEQEYFKTVSIASQKLILALHRNFEILKLDSEIPLNVSSLEELYSIFHCKLKGLDMFPIRKCLKIDINAINAQKHKQNMKSIQHLTPNLTSLIFRMNARKLSDRELRQCKTLLQNFDALGLRSKVRSFKIICEQNDWYHSRWAMSSRFFLPFHPSTSQAFKCLFCNTHVNNEKNKLNLEMPILETRLFHIFIDNDSLNLMITSQFFKFFAQNKSIILKCHPKLKSIVFDFRFSQRQYIQRMLATNRIFQANTNQATLGFNGFDATLDSMFRASPSTSNPYDATCTRVTVKKFTMQEQAFGKVYKNLIVWFQNIVELTQFATEEAHHSKEMRRQIVLRLR